MKIHIASALTPENLAILGAFDDFYAAYKECMDICDDYISQMTPEKETNLWSIQLKIPNNNFFISYREFEQIRELSRKQYRKICDPLLQKYTYLFYETEGKIHANAYGFRDFSMLYDCSKTFSEPWMILKKRSFVRFLVCIHAVVINVLSRWNIELKSFESIRDATNKRIGSLVQKERKQMVLGKSEFIKPTKAPLYCFGNLHNTVCYRDNHSVRPRAYGADLFESSKIVLLPAHYCDNCQKYFIGTKTMEVFKALLEKDYGKLLVERRRALEYDTDFGMFQDFQEESKLHCLGYNVIDGELTELERRSILLYILKNGIMSYLEVCSTIEQNIRLFQYSTRHQLAVEKWMDDLRYIGEWILEEKCDDN